MKVEDGKVELEEDDLVVHLALRSCYIRDISCLQNLPNKIRVLNLFDNYIRDLSALHHLPSNLLILDLSMNEIVDISPLITLPSLLKSLYLDKNRIVDVSPLQSLPYTLENLNLSYNSIQDTSVVIREMIYKPNLNVFFYGNRHGDPEIDQELRRKLIRDPNRKTRYLLLTLLSPSLVPRIGRNSALCKVHPTMARDLFRSILSAFLYRKHKYE